MTLGQATHDVAANDWGGITMAADSDNAYNAERLRSAGTLLLGRTTFSMFSAY
jgi:hypothetical protein